MVAVLRQGGLDDLKGVLGVRKEIRRQGIGGLHQDLLGALVAQHVQVGHDGLARTVENRDGRFLEDLLGGLYRFLAQPVGQHQATAGLGHLGHGLGDFKA